MVVDRVTVERCQVDTGHAAAQNSVLGAVDTTFGRVILQYEQTGLVVRAILV